MRTLETLPRAARPGSAWQRLWRQRWGLLFIAPFFVLFGVFSVYPILFSSWLSFQEWNGVPGRELFVGVENFSYALRDNLFWESMLNVVLIFALHLPLMMLVALVLAVILNQNFLRFQGLWRALIFLPVRRSMVSSRPRTSGPEGTKAVRSKLSSTRLAWRLDQRARLNRR